ncbi:PREDICTED: zinc finger protein 652 [Drosophila arizonae]|uniref:Zinc finger protein 652 n=1 Tax=Drosophila arizonae TaxID=7263 RepID=A0ABM1PUB9_DROAR|nr:PREDICTED: zinc finger protein 652 [Drosophila arizonae]
MICRLCLNPLNEQNTVLLFTGGDNEASNSDNKTIPENYLVQLISTHLYLCLSRDDAISTSICTDCRAQLESFHNFWKLVEHKQTTLCSQFLEIDCDVNWSEEGDAEQQQMQHPLSLVDYEQDADPDLEQEAVGDDTPAVYDVKDETEFHESYLKVDPKAAAAAHKFPCMFCDKSFKMRRYLEEHVATHTGDRPIACAYCNMAFRCRSNMYTHVKTKHNIQWQKARADRESAKINSNNNVQIQRTTNGDNSDKLMDALNVPSTELKPTVKLETSDATPAPALTPAPAAAALAAPQPQQPPPPQAPLVPPSIAAIKCEPMEAINLTMAKAPTCPLPAAKRVTRSSRRKTHLPKKVEHTTRSGSVSEDSSNEEAPPDPREKRLKTTELQTCKENELLLANYNAVAAVVAAATQQQQQLCATIMQQHHQEQLLTSMAAVSTSASSTTAAAAAATATLNSQSSTSVAVAPASCSLPAAEPYTCSICGQQLRNQRALKNHLHNKHNAMPAPIATATATGAGTATPTQTQTQSSTSTSPGPSQAALNICANCGELPGQNHRCLSKAKYACNVCGKSFKMKRYLEEHFATHTGVKLHTCAFCPTEFRSKSNMYHHTKRKHKTEWERSRATRNAAKSTASTEQQQQQEPEPEQLDETVTTVNS